MPQPSQMQVLRFEAPFGESKLKLAAADLAWRVVNLERTVDNTLRSVRGPCPYEPNRGQGYFNFGRIHGVFHANLVGMAPTLLVRAGTKLYRHAGWGRTFETLLTGLSDDATVRQADCFTLVGDKIIWSNGIDRAHVITYDGMAVPLGYDRAPGAPFIEGPTQPPSKETEDDQDRSLNYANAYGYSWPGKIGTLGDVRSPTEGSLLGGAWIYYEQWEDVHFNLSPLSAPSNPLSLMPQSSQEEVAGDNMKQVLVDDLLRQCFVRGSGDAVNHTMKRHLFRTSDTRNVDAQPRLVGTDYGVRLTAFPDNVPDAELGPVAFRPLPVSAFHLSCAWGDRLVIAIRGEIWVSERKLPGTFLPENRYAVAAGGAEITAIKLHNGALYVWTRRSMHDASGVLEGKSPRQVSGTVGCESQASVQSLPDGRLIWLSLAGFYVLHYKEGLQLASGSITGLIQKGASRGAFPAAVAAVDPISGEYRCAVTPAGRQGNTRMHTFDGLYWRELELGIEAEAMCVTDDERNMVLLAGRDSSASFRMIFPMDREFEQYTPPSRTSEFYSKWITASGDAAKVSAVTRLHVRELYIGLVDRYDGAINVSYYLNGGRAAHSTSTCLAIGVDYESEGDGATAGIAQETFGTAVLGTVKAREPRLFWRRIPVHIEDAYTFAFKLDVDYPAEFELAAFVITASPYATADVKARIPDFDDTDA